MGPARRRADTETLTMASDAPSPVDLARDVVTTGNAKDPFDGVGRGRVSLGVGYDLGEPCPHRAASEHSMGGSHEHRVGGVEVGCERVEKVVVVTNQGRLARQDRHDVA